MQKLVKGLPQYAIDVALLERSDELYSGALNSMFDADPKRIDKFSLEAAGLYLDYSKNHIDSALFDQLITLAEEADLPAAIERMFRGEQINTTEQRAALHIALRDRSEYVDYPSSISHEVREALAKMLCFAENVRSSNCFGYSGKAIKDIVVLGIGGSYLGPKLVCEALKDFDDSGLNIQFVASLDPAELLDALDRVDPERVLFMISSKSFGTLETLDNALAAKSWLLSQGCPVNALERHFVAATANATKAKEFGLTESHIFPLWDWVGGRYSLWSSVGFPIALAVGTDSFNELLDGAYQMDKHFRSAPFCENMPVIMALLGIWHGNYLGANAHAILPYSYRMRSLTEHLQQLDMESNGKGVTTRGCLVNYSTGPLILGGMGNNGQHAYYQLLHQGPERVPVDFILIRKPECAIDGNHQHLLANGIAHGRALMQGQNFDESVKKLQKKNLSIERSHELASHLVSHGNQPSNSLLLDKITPSKLGSLLALYEHKIYCQGVIWQLESFDQWGVELGKELGAEVFNAILEENYEFDSSTNELIKRCRVL